MTTPAARDNQSPLEAVLVDVHTTLAELLVAADEQYAAVVARDHERLESVTRQQERLSARLARAEAMRQMVLNGETLASAASASPHTRELHASIATAVGLLRRRQAQTASLLEQSIKMTGQTLMFLQRLVCDPDPVYGARGVSVQRPSVLVDSRA
jgi:flagellar biosynthesis/type III secretory pathway chaperone